MASKFGVSMTDPPIRHALPQRQPDVDQNSISYDAALPPSSASSPTYEFDVLTVRARRTIITAAA